MTTIRAPKATATTASGCVRRHSSGKTSATRARARRSPDHVSRSWLRGSPSVPAPRRAPSPATPAPAAGAPVVRPRASGRRCAHDLSVETPARRRIGPKYGSAPAQIGRSARELRPLARCGRRRSSHDGPRPVAAPGRHRSPRRTHDVAFPLPVGPVRRPSTLGRDRSLAGRVRPRGRASSAFGQTSRTRSACRASTPSRRPTC